MFMLKSLKQFVSVALGALCVTALTAFPAFADEAAGITSSAGMSQMLVLVGFIFIFYFLMWRPQSKRAKQHRALIASLDKEDEVVTSGGILGRVVKVTDSFIVLSIAEGIEIPIQKNAVAASLPKGTIKSI